MYLNLKYRDVNAFVFNTQYIDMKTYDEYKFKIQPINTLIVHYLIETQLNNLFLVNHISESYLDVYCSQVLLCNNRFK